MFRPVLVALVWLPLAAQNLPAQNSGTVEGTVVNRLTGAGIGGVVVVLHTGQSVQYETTSDDLGKFRATGIRPGSYEVRYEKSRFKPFREDPPAPYRIGSGSNVPLHLEMTPLVTLRGRVLTGDGKPALRAEVRISSFFAFVNERGEFEFNQLEPGSYTMLAKPGPGRLNEQGMEPVQTFFPSALDQQEASRAVVRGDRDLAGYEIRLRSMPVRRVRGTVLDEAGHPLIATVRLLATGGRQRQVIGNAASDYFAVVGPEAVYGPLEASTITSEDGSFEFPAVRAGDWRIMADAGIRFGNLSLSVAGSNIDHVEIRAMPAMPFAMNVTIDWDMRAAKVSLLNSLPGRKLVLADGRIRSENVRPGRYRVLPSSEQGYYPASALLGGKEVLGQMVELDSRSTALKIVYKTATGSVSGIAAKGATVVLFPQETQGVGFGRMVRCDPSGKFTVDGVRAGEYSAIAMQGIDATFLTDPSLMRWIAAHGEKVILETGPIQGLKLNAIAWPD